MTLPLPFPCKSKRNASVKNASKWFVLFVCLTNTIPTQGINNLGADWSYDGATVTLAQLNLTYHDSITGKTIKPKSEVGRFGIGSVGSVSGVLILGNDFKNGTTADKYGCTKNWLVHPPEEPWIALISRGGGCSDLEKVKVATSLNASAVIIFAADQHAHLQPLQMASAAGKRAIVVFLNQVQGDKIASLVENSSRVDLSVTRGQEVKFRITNINRSDFFKMFVFLNPICEKHLPTSDCVILTSVLFVSVSFIILMIISLAWLIFYYIQRFRYINAKDKLARHLTSAAEKALSKIPIKTLKSQDKEVVSDDCCAVCIESYTSGDTIRILPCKHTFHKLCVDPWLLDHRTCPMCKMDILKHYGLVQEQARLEQTTPPILSPPQLPPMFRSIQQRETVYPEREEEIIYLDMDDEDYYPEIHDSDESLQIDMIEDAVAAATAEVTNAPRSINDPPVVRSASATTQVLVIPRHEAGPPHYHCDQRNSTPIPPTPIAPIHQEPSASSSSASVIRSVIGSARSMVSPALPINSNQVNPVPSPSPRKSLNGEGFSSHNMEPDIGRRCPISLHSSLESLDDSSMTYSDSGDEIKKIYEGVELNSNVSDDFSFNNYDNTNSSEITESNLDTSDSNNNASDTLDNDPCVENMYSAVNNNCIQPGLSSNLTKSARQRIRDLPPISNYRNTADISSYSTSPLNQSNLDSSRVIQESRGARQKRSPSLADSITLRPDSILRSEGGRRPTLISDSISPRPESMIRLENGSRFRPKTSSIIRPGALPSRLDSSNQNVDVYTLRSELSTGDSNTSVPSNTSPSRRPSSHIVSISHV